MKKSMPDDLPLLHPVICFYNIAPDVKQGGGDDQVMSAKLQNKLIRYPWRAKDSRAMGIYSLLQLRPIPDRTRILTKKFPDLLFGVLFDDDLL